MDINAVGGGIGTPMITLDQMSIEKAVKAVLGIDVTLHYSTDYFTKHGAHEFPINADFNLWELAESAEVLDVDTLFDAAMAGVCHYLEENKEELQVKLYTTLAIMREEFLSDISHDARYYKKELGLD